jgi:hypothetical protein
LGGPFLQNFYSGIKPTEITITSQPSELHVLPLPTSGRPADFSGAVGTFKVSSDVSASHMPAGDPVTLRLHVSGAGNFDRVDSQMLERNDQWKTYPPKSSFSATDLIGYKGEKTFEQPLIAAQSGDQTIPALSFSYFDPETKRYERAQTAPIKVTIDAARADGSLEAAATTPGARLANRAAELPRPDHAPTPAAETLVPLYLQPRYLAIPAALVLLFAAGLFARGRAPRSAVPKATQRAVNALSDLVHSGLFPGSGTCPWRRLPRPNSMPTSARTPPISAGCLLSRTKRNTRAAGPPTPIWRHGCSSCAATFWGHHLEMALPVRFVVGRRRSRVGLGRRLERRRIR